MKDIFSNIAALYARYQESGVKTDIGPYDNMYQASREAHYFSVGEDAISIIAGAMIKTNIRTFSQVLDMPSGSGRVLRHLKAFLPHANFTAGDIDENHVNYCVNTFDAQPFQTQEDLLKSRPETQMDLIFCGSLLTHFHGDRFKKSLLHMTSWLVNDGLLIVTLHGRWPMWRQAHTPHPYMSPEDFAPIKIGVEKDGFGYVDYDSNSDRIGQGRYGLSVSLPAWVMAFLQSHPELRIVDFQERGWDNHQDVLIIQKKKVSAKPWIFK